MRRCTETPPPTRARQVYLTRKMEDKSQMFPFSSPMESFTFQTNNAYKAYQAIFAAQSNAVHSHTSPALPTPPRPTLPHPTSLHLPSPPLFHGSSARLSKGRRRRRELCACVFPRGAWSPAGGERAGVVGGEGSL